MFQSSAFVCVDLDEFKTRQERYLNTLYELHKEGLQAAHVLVLARTWSQGAYVHLLRTLLVSDRAAEDLDKGLGDFLCEVLGATLDGSPAQHDTTHNGRGRGWRKQWELFGLMGGGVTHHM